VKQCTTDAGKTDAGAQSSSVDLTDLTVAAVRSGLPHPPPDVSVTTGSATGTSGASSRFARPGSAPPRGRSSRGRSAMTTDDTIASPIEDIGSTVARLVASAKPLGEALRTQLRLLLTESSGS
jgi:hypothetical protein